MRRIKIKLMVILLICLWVQLTPTNAIVQYQELTFTELGFSTSTYHYGDNVSLYLNCNGSEIDYYFVQLYIHKTNVDTTLSYQINNNSETFIGDDEGLGWKSTTIQPGKFMNGTNKVLLRIYNSPMSREEVQTDWYYTIFADSYFAVYNEFDEEPTTTSVEMETTSEQEYYYINTNNSNDNTGIAFLIGIIFGAVGVSIFVFISNKEKHIFLNPETNEKKP